MIKNNKKITSNFIQISLLIIYVLCFLVIFLLNVYNEVLFTLLLSILFVIIYFIIKKRRTKLNNIINNKKILIILLIIPILIRVMLLCFSYSDVYSDEATFYNNAIAISENGVINSRYIAVFPYLYSYINLLGNVFKIFGSNYVIVVLTNIIIDLIGAFIFYKFLKNIKNKEFAKIGLFLWLYNPFQIIWDLKCLPVIIVNTLIILSLYIFSILYKKIPKIKYNLLFSILLGIILSLTNSFRPIIIIFIIALFMYYVYLGIIKKYDYKSLIISFIVIFSFFQIGNFINKEIVSNVTNYEIDKSSSGWSIYLGSCYETSGQWQPVDEFNEIISSENFTPTELHNYFKEEGIKNYKENGINNIKLMIKKANVLTSNFNEYSIDNLYDKINLSISKEIINSISKIFWLLLILSNITIIKLKNKDIKVYFPYLLFFIGLFISSLLVEVSPRYLTPNLVVMMLGSTITIYELLYNKN